MENKKFFLATDLDDAVTKHWVEELKDFLVPMPDFDNDSIILTTSNSNRLFRKNYHSRFNSQP